MAWPSGSKAGTTNVDADTDNISNARADIKQNIDNVNDIIDTFNIGAEDSAGTPEDGQLIQYSSTTGKWEAVASTEVGGGRYALFYPTHGAMGTGEANKKYFFDMTLEYNSGGVESAVQTEDSGGQIELLQNIDSATEMFYFTITSGTYMFDALGLWPTAGSGGGTTTFKLWNHNTETGLDFVGGNKGDDVTELRRNLTYFTASTTQIGIYASHTTSALGEQDVWWNGGIEQSWRLMVTKLS
tara:strand:+ start:1058 stop:1783 length:726 start_codon:yes stop_codon:yes gene_type:complete